MLLTGSLPWGPLFSGNLRAGVTLPWAVVPMALWLGAYWKVVSGAWGDSPSRPERRRHLHARPLSWALWRWSIAAGLVGLATILALLRLAARLVALPDGVPITTPAGMPMLTTVALLTMQSTVAGVTEEAAFRGYMQTMVARRHGIVIAVLAQGTLFGLLHAPNHPGAVALMLPYYMAVSAVYGGLTWAADSILPAITLHVVGDAVVLTRWWLTARPEWQIGSAVPALVRNSGLDEAFVATGLTAFVLAAATVGAFAAVRTRRLREAATSAAAF